MSTKELEHYKELKHDSHQKVQNAIVAYGFFTEQLAEQGERKYAKRQIRNFNNYLHDNDYGEYKRESKKASRIIEGHEELEPGWLKVFADSFHEDKVASLAPGIYQGFKSCDTIPEALDSIANFYNREKIKEYAYGATINEIESEQELYAGRNK